MIQAKRVGHASFETPDLAKAVAYYTDVNGLVLNATDKGRAFLASKTGLLSVVLEQADAATLKRLSFEVSPNADFTDMAKQPSTLGMTCELRTDPVPGISRVLTFNDPAGFSTCSCLR